MSDTTFQQLFPGSEAGVEAAGFVAGLEADRELPPDRPLVLVNMVSTLDGNASFQGRSAPLSGPGDRQMFHALRAGADAIMAGTGTLAAERYRPAGKPVVTVTRSGNVPADIPLFSEPGGRAIVFSSTAPQLGEVAAEVSVEPYEDLGPALGTLRSSYGIQILLCEGGPGLFGAMIRAGLVDELFLTLSPTLAGGRAGPGPTSGDPAPELEQMTLGSVLECSGMLFLRYRRAREGTGLR